MKENFVFAEIVKHFYNSFRQPNIYFWRDNTGNEIDCIVKEISNLKMNLGSSLDKLVEKLVSVFKTLENLQQAIAIEKKT